MYDMTDEKVFNVGIVGCGQGGGRICEAFYSLGYENALAINTAPQDLKHLSLSDDQKLLLESDRQGAGKDPSVSKKLATQSHSEIISKMAHNFGEVDRIFVCVSAGGGTGTGSCIPVVQTAKDYLESIGLTDSERRVGIIVSTPTDGEGRSRAVSRNAFVLLNEISKLAKDKQISPAILIENEKIKTVFPGLKMREFWPVSNSSVAKMFDIFNSLPCQDSMFSSFDPADFENVMSAHGFMTIGGTRIVDDYTAESMVKAFEKNLEHTIISSGYRLGDSKSGACVICISEDVVDEEPGLMDEIDKAMDEVSVKMGSDYIHRGIYISDDEGITVYSIIGGLPQPTSQLTRLKNMTR